MAAATLSQADAAAPVSFAAALRFWCKLGFIGFGGPAGQIAIMHRELVQERRWISEERFLHALNFCMLLPGPEATQLATYIGWLQHGVRGAIAAGVLFVLPGFVLITAISVLYVSFSSLAPVQGVLFGLRAAVLAVVIEAVLRIGSRALKNRTSWLIAGAAFVAIFAFAVPFPVIVLAAAVSGFCLQRWRTSRGERAVVVAPEPLARTQSRSTIAYTIRIILVCCALWFLPLVLIQSLLGPEHVLTREGWFFSKMAVVTFGGAYAVLAYVAQEAVGRFGWLSPDDMLQGLALAETTPGPLILVLTFVGFVAGFRHGAPLDPWIAGLLGAVLTTWVTFVPCFLWILVGAPHIERLRRQQALSAALATVTAAVVGVILNLAIWFALHALFRDVRTWSAHGVSLPIPQPGSVDVPAVVIAAGAMLAMLRFRAPMLPVLGACAAAGLLVTWWMR
jgi:chromate transporter